MNLKIAKKKLKGQLNAQKKEKKFIVKKSKISWNLIEITDAFKKHIINTKDELDKCYDKFRIKLSNKVIILNGFTEGIISMDNKEI